MTAVFLICATVTSACAQGKPKRMIPGPSVKQLVPESPIEKEDGIAQITFGEIFKQGITEYVHVGANGLRDTPPLPTGFALYKDLAFRLNSTATISGDQLTVFKLPSADNETEFSKLNILHLEDDEMSPAGRSWIPVTVVPGGWDDYFKAVSKAQYDAVLPDFKARRIAAVTNGFGIFVIASSSGVAAESDDPFTNLEVSPTSSPDPVAEDGEVTYRIVLRNKGPKDVGDVNLKHEIHADLRYVSASSTQGSCKESRESNGRVLCYLGALPIGGTATITVVARVRPNIMLTKDKTEVGNLLEVVFKETPTDLIESRGQIHKQFNTTILKKR